MPDVPDVPAIPPATLNPPRRKSRSELTGDEALAILARQAEEQRLRGIAFRKRQAAEGKSRFSIFLPSSLHPEMRRHAALLMRRYRPDTTEPAQLVESSREVGPAPAPDIRDASASDTRTAPGNILASAADRVAPTVDRDSSVDPLTPVVDPGSAVAPVVNRLAPVIHTPERATPPAAPGAVTGAAVVDPARTSPASPAPTPSGSRAAAPVPASHSGSVATPPPVATKTPSEMLAEQVARRRAMAQSGGRP